MDSRLSRWKDADGQVVQICQICANPTRYEDLAPAPTEGVRWDVCFFCHETEFNRAADYLIRRLMPKIPEEYREGFDCAMTGGEYAMAVNDLVTVIEDHHIELLPVEARTIRFLTKGKTDA